MFTSQPPCPLSDGQQLTEMEEMETLVISRSIYSKPKKEKNLIRYFRQNLDRFADYFLAFDAGKCRREIFLDLKNLDKFC